MFLLPLGRTNTEYYNLNPVYGSNINAAAAGRKVRHFYSLIFIDNLLLNLFTSYF